MCLAIVSLSQVGKKKWKELGSKILNEEHAFVVAFTARNDQEVREARGYLCSAEETLISWCLFNKKSNSYLDEFGALKSDFENVFAGGV